MFQEIGKPSQNCLSCFFPLSWTAPHLYFHRFFLLYSWVFSGIMLLESLIFYSSGSPGQEGTAAQVRYPTPTTCSGMPGQDHLEHLKFKNYVAGWKMVLARSGSVQSTWSRKKKIFKYTIMSLYRNSKMTKESGYSAKLIGSRGKLNCSAKKHNWLLHADVKTLP